MEKRHHYVPRFYLGYFARPTEEGRPPVVWVYDKDGGKPRAQQPKDTAVVGRLYTMERPEGKKDTSLEKIFAGVEARAKPILDRWQRSGAVPEPWELPIVADFLATLHGRVPWAARIAEEFGVALLTARIKELAKDPATLKRFWDERAEERGLLEGITFEEFCTSLSEFERRFKLTMNPTVSMGLGLLQAKGMFPELMDMKWCLCRAPRTRFFITSDAPVNLFVPRGDKAIFGAGYGLQAAEIAFPLSPDVCLYLSRRSAPPRRSVSQAFVNEMNKRASVMAERFVFSHVRSRTVQAMVSGFAFTRQLPKVDSEDIERQFRARRKQGSGQTTDGG